MSEAQAATAPDAASSPHLAIETAGGVRTITLDRPDKLNAVTHAMLADLRQAFLDADADDAVRVVVVTGRGRAFCAGADLSGGAGRFDYRGRPAGEHRDPGGQVTLAAHACRKPVIAAVNGAAVGFGAAFILAADVRLAATTARIGYVYARRGIVPEGASSWFLPRIVGIARALEWMSTGRLVDAHEALAAGLFHRLYEPDALLPAAHAVAAEIVEQTSAVSVALAREMLWRGQAAASPMEAHLLESRMMHERGASADAREGVNAFLEKRAPRFPDRVGDLDRDLLEPPTG